MAPFLIDPDSKAQSETFALVATRRTNRKRFPETCVQSVEDQQAALKGHNPEKGVHAAFVYGPSYSSEGQRIYHLIRWIC